MRPVSCKKKKAREKPKQFFKNERIFEKDYRYYGYSFYERLSYGRWKLLIEKRNEKNVKKRKCHDHFE